MHAPEDLPLDTKLLEQLSAEAYQLDVAPLFIRNYVGEQSHPLSKPFRELEAHARELLGAATDEEVCRLAESIPDGFRRCTDTTMPLRERERAISSLAPTIVEWRVALLRRNFDDVLRLRPPDGQVLKTYPELAALLDDDDLLILDERFRLTDGAVLYKRHALYYHQLLRRGFTARPNFDLLGRFSAYRAACTENTFRVALDHSRLMPIECYQRLVELDAWYGPPWNAATLDDPNAVGTTVHWRNPTSLFGQVNKLRFTDFLWTFRDGIKTFQVEEVSEPDYLFGSSLLNRYVHSERDVALHRFRHLDGAVKVYANDDYAWRLDAHLPDVARCQKQKLFRIDGNIELDVWLELVGFFFRSNEMILEYFDPAAFVKVFPFESATSRRGVRRVSLRTSAASCPTERCSGRFGFGRLRLPLPPAAERRYVGQRHTPGEPL